MYQKRIALESFVQRGRSVLFNGLVSVCQNAIDVVRELHSDDKRYVFKVLSKTNFQEDLKTVISKYLGNLFDSVKLISDTSPNAAMIVFHRPKMISNQYKKMSSNMILTDISKYFDDKNFQIDTSNIDKIYAEFKMIINVGFFYLKDSEGNFLFSPEEIAAVILHELGHIDYLLRTEARSIKILQNSSDIVNYLQNTPDLETIKEIISYIEKSDKLNSDWNKIFKTTKKYFDTNPNQTDPIYIEALNSLILVLGFYTSVRVNKYLNQDMLVSYSKIKTSEFFVDNERSADEFAARNGAYSSLVSALSKMYKRDSEMTKNSYILDSPFKLDSIGRIFWYFEEVFNFKMEYVNSEYDPILRRLNLIVETAKHAFHDPNLDQETKQYIREEISNAEKYIKDFSSQKHVRIRRSLYKWMTTVEEIGKLIALPFKSRLTVDYHRLQQTTRSLTRHPLYYLADK